MEPTLIGSRYEVLCDVGSGAVGVLYKAKDRSLRKIVAVKLLHSNQVTPARIIRLQKEARLLCQLQHVNLVTVYDFGMDQSGSPYLVMEYIEGMSLIEYVGKYGPLPLPLAIDIFGDICSGLDHAHQHGVLHRDLKPSNIMLAMSTTDGGGHLVAKIVDFGLAKTEEDETSEQRITVEGAVMGSPLYVSPEQAQSQPTDKRSDIYSFGCVMFFALTGSPPFRGDTGNATVLMQINDAPPTVSSKLPDKTIPAELENIIATALKKKPADRFQTLDKLQTILDSIAEELSHPRSSKHQLLEPTLHITPRVTMEQPEQTEVRKEIKFVFIVAIVALVCLIPLMIGQQIEKERPQESVSEALEHHSQENSKSIFDSGSQNFEIMKRPRLHEMLTTYQPYTGERLHWFRGMGIIDDAVIPRLCQDHATIPYLRLWEKDVTGEGLRGLQNRSIQGLDLTACLVNDKGMADIARLKDLHLLVLNNNGELNDDSLSYITKLPRLEYLAVRYNHFTDRGIKTIAMLSKLQGLDLTGNIEITSEGLKPLFNLKKLDSLGIGHTSVSKTCLRDLLARFDFRGLDLSGMKLEDADIDEVLSEPLVVLSLKDNDITDDGLAKIRKIPTLKHVIVNNCKNLTDAGKIAISLKCPELQVHVDDDVIRNGQYLNKSHSALDRLNIAY